MKMTRQRRYLAIVFVMLSLLVIALGRRAWADTEPLMHEALVVSLAMENNPQMAIADKRVEQARAAVAEEAYKLAQEHRRRIEALYTGTE